MRGKEEWKKDRISHAGLLLLFIQDVKINQKHNQLVRELSDLINQPSPTSSRHTVENNSRMLIHEKVNDRSMQSFESKLAGMCVC